jgi:hypothetical protein
VSPGVISEFSFIAVCSAFVLSSLPDFPHEAKNKTLIENIIIGTIMQFFIFSFILDLFTSNPLFRLQSIGSS